MEAEIFRHRERKLGMRGEHAAAPVLVPAGGTHGAIPVAVPASAPESHDADQASVPVSELRGAAPV